MNYNDKMLYAFVQQKSKFLFYKEAFQQIEMGKYVFSWYGFFFNTAFLYYRNILPMSVCFAYIIVAFPFLNFGTFVKTMPYGSHIFLSICYLLYMYIFGLLPMNLIKNSFDKTKLMIENNYETEEQRIAKMLYVSRPKNEIVIFVLIVVPILLVGCIILFAIFQHKRYY